MSQRNQSPGDLSDLEKIKEQQKKNNKMNIILLLVVFVGAIAYSFFAGGSGKSTLTFTETGFAITDSDGISTSVKYTEITSVTLYEDADYGTAAGGTVSSAFSGKQMEGSWQSDTFGAYTACCSQRYKTAILVKTNSASYVINLESNDTTKALYEALLREWGRDEIS